MKTTNSRFMTKNKMYAFLVACIALVALGVFSYANDEKSNETDAVGSVSEEVGDLAESVRKFTYEEKEDASEFVGRKVDSLELKIDKIETQISQKSETMSGKVKQQHEEALESLRSQQLKLETWVSKLNDSTRENWEEVQNDFSDVYQKSEEAVQDLLDEIS